MPGKLMNFDLPKGQSSIIKVIGVGGGGSNAVNHMFSQGIKGVDFVVCNTDSQALDNSPVPHKIQLGSGLTEGLGAGGDPNVGKNSALENIEQIKEILESNTQMVFVTAGMGGGTGTGGAPVIAAIAKEMNILTVGIVTIPFSNEGPKRKQQAEEGLDKLRESVDALIIICNDKLREMYGNLTLSTAFLQADNVLATAARGIAEMISVHGTINVDFRDVSTVMKDSGVAIMGSAVAEGENRAVKAVELALASPLLNDNKITGARYVLLNITTGKEEPLLDEITDISDYVQQEAGNIANVIMGVSTDDTFEDQLSVTIIAAGFETNPDLGFVGANQPERVVRNLTDPSQPTIVHQLDDKEVEETKETEDTEEATPPGEKVPIFPPIVTAKPPVEPNVIEDTPERKVFELKMEEEEKSSTKEPEVEEEMKLIKKKEPAKTEEEPETPVEEPKAKKEETKAVEDVSTDVSTGAEAKEEAPVEEVASAKDEEPKKEIEEDSPESTGDVDKEEIPKPSKSFWDTPTFATKSETPKDKDEEVKAEAETVEEEKEKDVPADESTVANAKVEAEAEAKEEASVKAEAESDEAANEKKAELDSILNKFPTPPQKQEKPKAETGGEPGKEQKEEKNEKQKEEPIVDKKLEEQEVVGKAEDKAEVEEEPEEADMPEFKLMGDDKSGEEDKIEIELSTDTSSSLGISKTSLSDISSGDDDALSSSSLGDESNLSSYSSPNSMDQSERISKLKELSYKLRTPSGVSDLEEQPAYMRRNVDLEDVPHSSKSEVSRFSLDDTEEGEDKIELKPDNPFLHDNVD